MSDKGIYSSPRWTKLRFRILARAKYLCENCGRSLRGKGAARVDHIKPVRTHPELIWDEKNLRALCPTCDNKRHSEKGSGVEKPQIGLDGWPIE